MVVYHGGTEIIEIPRIIRSDVGRDFGVGFYTTDIEEQAIRWAHRKALAASRFISDAKAILNIFKAVEI